MRLVKLSTALFAAMSLSVFSSYADVAGEVNKDFEVIAKVPNLLRITGLNEPLVLDKENSGYLEGYVDFGIEASGINERNTSKPYTINVSTAKGEGENFILTHADENIDDELPAIVDFYETLIGSEPVRLKNNVETTKQFTTELAIGSDNNNVRLMAAIHKDHFYVSSAGNYKATFNVMVVAK